MASRKRQSEPAPSNELSTEADEQYDGPETPETAAPLARRGVRYVTKGGKRVVAKLQTTEDGEKL